MRISPPMKTSHFDSFWYSSFYIIWNVDPLAIPSPRMTETQITSPCATKICMNSLPQNYGNSFRWAFRPTTRPSEPQRVAVLRSKTFQDHLIVTAGNFKLEMQVSLVSIFKKLRHFTIWTTTKRGTRKHPGQYELTNTHKQRDTPSFVRRFAVSRNRKTAQCFRSCPPPLQ